MDRSRLLVGLIAVLLCLLAGVGLCHLLNLAGLL